MRLERGVAADGIKLALQIVDPPAIAYKIAEING